MGRSIVVLAFLWPQRLTAGTMTLDSFCKGIMNSTRSTPLSFVDVGQRGGIVPAHVICNCIHNITHIREDV